MEEFRADVKEVKQDLKDVKSTLVENTVKLAEYNAELKVHIQASKDLNLRMIPIEHHVVFIRKLVRLIVVVMGILASMATIARLWV